MADSLKPPLADLCVFRHTEAGYVQEPCGQPRDAECHTFDGCVYRAEIESGTLPSIGDMNFWCHQHHTFEAANG